MSNSISFTKYHGAGNDFILIDDRSGRFPKENRLLIQKMCHRQFGIGADGVILLALRKGADFSMRIYNQDGCEAASCGNGLRCLVQFLRELGIVQQRYQIRTRETTVEAFFQQEQPVIGMGQPQALRCGIETVIGVVHCVEIGVSHAVQFVSNIDAVDVPVAGTILRNALNANVNFAAVQEDGSIRARTFERGIEGETLACGTGAVAVGYLASQIHGLRGTISIHFRGGSLAVWQEDGKFFLRGPAEKVFTGFFSLSTLVPS